MNVIPSLTEFLDSGAIFSLDQETVLIGWGEKRTCSYHEKNTQDPAFYIPDFFLKSQKPWIQYSQWMEISNQTLLSLLGSDYSVDRCEWIIPDASHFQETFNDLLKQFQEHSLKKAVPYIFAYSQHKMDEKRLKYCLMQGFNTLNKVHGNLYGFWDSMDGKGVLGITPEILFSHDTQQPKIVYTMALAGTCEEGTSQSDFIENSKERYEHELVVQGICQDLKELGSVHANQLKLLKISPLTHLMTPIELELRGLFDFDTLVHKLHPTAALGAFPRTYGKKWLVAYDQHIPRHYYGAPFGFIYPQKGLSRCLVAIRNMQWNHEGIRIGAGCGVVKQSLLQNEWNEIQLKIKAVRELFSL